MLGNLSQLIGIYLLQQQNILATGNSAQAEDYLKDNRDVQVLSSGDGILQDGGEAETEEPEENEFLISVLEDSRNGVLRVQSPLSR